MIPKVIHYCWFGGKPLPKSAKKCIASWKKFMPDYEVKEWNESNFDIDLIPYTREAYNDNKYAFVSDVARFWLLYHEGGMYFDTDVEVITPMDGFISQGAFLGWEKPSAVGLYNVNPGLGMAAPKGLPFYQEMLDGCLKYPENYIGHKMLAEVYEQEGGMRKAIDEYVQAVDANKQDYDSYYKIAELLTGLDKQDEAAEMLFNLLHKKPDCYKATELL